MRKLSMYLFGHRGVGLRCFNLCFEPAEVVSLAVGSDVGLPCAQMPVDTLVFTRPVLGVPDPCVHHALARSGFAELFPAVVSRFAVAMVDKRRRLLTGHPFPDDPVTEVEAPINPDCDVAIQIIHPTSSASMDGIVRAPGILEAEMLPRALFPSQHTGLRVVVEALAKVCGWWQSARSHAFLRNGRLVRTALALPSWRGPHHAMVGVV